MARLGRSDLEVFPLCLGGNVFGWTADEAQSFAVLDAYVAAGGNFVDTSDSYSAFAPGNIGGESETVLGNWFAARGNRSDIVLATKVGRKRDRLGLSRDNIRAAVAESLERLQTDHIDLYYAHADDPDTPLEETLAAFDELIKQGIVRALARGFLTGKYRPGVQVDSPRAGAAGKYLEDPRADALLATIDRVAAAHDTTVAAVALAWVRAQPAVAAPLASARNPQQLADILPGASLELSDGDLRELSDVSAPAS